MAKSVGGFIEDVTGINTGDNSASDRALRAQTGAASDANATQRYIFDQTRKDNEKWRNVGVAALGDIRGTDDFNRDFTMNDFQADPGYQFRMAEGQKAIERSAAARGGLNSGATLKALTRYGQDVGSQEYQNAYNRFNSDRDRRFNRLASLAGVGQTANAQNATAGMNYANNYGQNVTGAANATASNEIAGANRRTHFMQQGGDITAALFSDERLKTNVEPISKEDLSELKATLRAVKFNYIKEQHGIGDWVGVMAQDLEKSKLGKTLLVEDSDGFKRLDLRKVMSLFLATLAEG